jgi:GTP cyclohydrolase II
MSMEYIHANAPGIVIYLWQEGRGIGLANKIAAYALQEQGLDTVDANRALGLPDDSREYTSVRNILKELGVKSIKLMTNNPRKINVLTELGVKVNGRVPCQIQAGTFNQVRIPTACTCRPLHAPLTQSNHRSSRAPR